MLRLAASDFIEAEHAQLPVGERSSLRAQLVSDRWLANLGTSIGIESLLNLGAKAKGDRAARATLRAEHCEALMGAIYRISGNIKPVQAWLTPYWRQTSHEVLADPSRGNSKSALQEWTQAQGLGLPTYECQEISHRHGDPVVFIAKCSSKTAKQQKPGVDHAARRSRQPPKLPYSNLKPRRAEAWRRTDHSAGLGCDGSAPHTSRTRAHHDAPAASFPP